MTTPPSSRGVCRRWPSRRSAASVRITLLWRDFGYEYEFERLAIDLINGSPLLREWVDDPAATPADLDALTLPDEAPGASPSPVPDLLSGRPAELRAQAGKHHVERDPEGDDLGFDIIRLAAIAFSSNSA